MPASAVKAGCVTGLRFDDGPAWIQRHRDWLAGVVLDWPAAQATLFDVHGSIDALCHRRDALEREIVAQIPSSPWQVQVGRVAVPARDRHADRGRMCPEIGDLERWPAPSS